jgi:hypothetical protein
MPSVFDCKGATPQIPYQPTYWQCWGLGGLPNSLRIRRFGISTIPGAPTCTDLPFDTTMTRQDCDFRWFVQVGDDGFVFGPIGPDGNPAGQPPFGSQINQPTLLPVASPPNPGWSQYGPSWGLSGTANTAIEAYCFKDGTTGVVTFYFLTHYTSGNCQGYIEITSV